jgi:sialic acid synthase SpsE
MSTVDNNFPAFIIAEIGSNHAQDLAIAEESIYAAAAAGANAVKFQSLNVTAQYLDPTADLRDLHRRIDLDENWYHHLKACSDKAGVQFFSSPTYFHALTLLEAVNVSCYKLASAQVGTFPQLVEAVAQLGKPVILSTGLADYVRLSQTIQLFERAGNDQYTILHCNSLYPPRFEEVQLELMDTYRHMFHCPVGYSDHAPGTAIALAAVARGAQVIEKHFILDPQLDTPDASTSIDPTTFAHMVRDIRAIEAAVPARPRLQLHPQEAAFRDRIVTRLVLKNPKRAGERFSPSDFDGLRHTDGIDGRDLDWIVAHMCAAQDLPAAHLLRWEELQGAAHG